MEGVPNTDMFRDASGAMKQVVPVLMADGWESDTDQVGNLPRRS